MKKKQRDNPFISVTAIQMNSTGNVQYNLENIESHVGALNHLPDIIVLPEVYNYRANNTYSEPIHGKSTQFLQALAKKINTTIIAGSFTESGGLTKSYNTTLVINSNGDIIGMYRKMHLFDAELDHKKIAESDRFFKGNHPEIVTINGWRVGLSICYDLRFPELFRWYFKKGIDIIVIPSSFTFETGQKHWHILCRARAIENQCYVIAPNQCGLGQGNQKTFGHSLIISPSGEILAEADEETSMCISQTLSKKELNSIQSRFPTKRHQRLELN
jgi:predicted amidohydrolase